MSKIYLVSMPFAAAEWPSIGIGLLAAATRKEGMNVKAIYPSLLFAETIGIFEYDLIAAVAKVDGLFAEWFFSRAAFKDYKFADDEYLSIYLKNDLKLLKMAQEFYGANQTLLIKKFKEIRRESEKFIEKIAQDIVEEKPKIVGCSNSFMQHCSSLALLRKIKEISPSIVTILGGANCEAEMGYITKKNCGWIDFVVSGEADTLFPDLCKNIIKNGTALSLEDTPYGVYSEEKLSLRSGNNIKDSVETAIVKKMDGVPRPDYSDYFKDLEKTNLKEIISPLITMETSRGCWKGFKKTCNFCGLNGKRSYYRSKSSGRVQEELDFLSKKYDINTFLMTDTILNPGYFKNLLKDLSEKKNQYRLYFETRSNLNESQVNLLANAGVCWIQSGIESLHDELLNLLNKNTSAIDSIALLKYALEKGIKVTWNLLYNIPGDSDQYYQEMADILPLLYHFEPPSLFSIRYDRFSPYHENAKKFGLNLTPLKLYEYIYPYKGDDLSNFAYFFEDNSISKNRKQDTPGVEIFKKSINKWRNSFNNGRNNGRPELTLTKTDNKIVVSDTRSCASSSEHILTGDESYFYGAFRNPATKIEVFNRVSSSKKIQIDSIDFEKAVNNLIDKKLLLRIDKKYLSLANFKPEKELTIGFVVNKPPSTSKSKNSSVSHQLKENAAWDWFATTNAN